MQYNLTVPVALIATLFTSSVMGAKTDAKVDPSIPEYSVTEGVSGKLVSVGSDTLANLMSLWTEEFKKLYPNIQFEVQAAGSSTAPPALTEGTSNLGPMSRFMKPTETAMFERRHGYKPTRVAVAMDALIVYVNKDNPIKGLTIPQVDAIFSSTRKCGARDNISTWGDLGLTGEWKNKPIQLFGRNSVSGTYGYFKTHALCRGDFKSEVNEQPGSASVVQSVSKSLNGVGYSGIGYQTASVKSVPLSKRSKRRFIPPTVRNALTGRYPLTRNLYVYINKQPNKPIEPLVYEFLKMVLSKQGQKAVVRDGYIPLPKRMVDRQLKRLEN
ncbi:MAG: phosphate ABC transporter substrate-binding protein PstS family protein [Hydrogenovibrio sp.]|uniref:PstS family phosphate ABC transporter substrate-binding protein n=1 Tax=Hydrogenovibrio sp. TaxID=2065821 RepID=UPI002870905C|nr:phosphate ABC transporter substrate-binding protein PstS family protein [Hydrogenovibrio sp.]MDR9499541.1 phosphate ABC transporter substrate-binding protein PstS family protein [Hydrogenovibrio sp.]